MKYIIKFNNNDALEYTYSIEEIRQGYREGRFPATCRMRTAHSNDWRGISEFLEASTQPINPQETHEQKGLLSAVEALAIEVRLVREQCAKTKWAVRGVVLLIAPLVLFGFKIALR
jgi:hypothetical protein